MPSKSERGKSYCLFLEDGPAAGQVITYPGHPTILVVCRGGRWHDYRNIDPSSQIHGGSDHYRHSEDCKCRT